MNKYEVGVITDGKLGCNFAKRLKENGYSCVLFNTGLEKMSRVDINSYVSEMQENGIHTATSVEITLSLLEKPRRIFIVSRGNSYAKAILEELYNYADAGDIIIDTCDSDYKVTRERCREFKQKKNVSYLGVGFSGEAAELFNGTSLMVGGSRDAYLEIYDILRNISSKFGGHECCAYMGPDGAGQYAKMIHNGIEYGMLQAISESISLLEHIVDYDMTLIFEAVSEWLIGDNESFLIQAMYEIMSKKDSESEQLLKNMVSDKVGYSQSVLWLCNSAAELGEPVPSIYSSLCTRFMSGLKKERAAFSESIRLEKSGIVLKQREKKSFVTDVRNALYLALICVHAQAFNLLKHRATAEIWGTSTLDVAVTFQGGAFIRSRLLSRVIDAYKNKPDLKNLLEDAYFVSIIRSYLPSLQNVIIKAAEGGVSIPVLSSALSYLYDYSEISMDTGIIELARDYIQGTGFELKDSNVKCHANWKNTDNITIYKDK